MVRGMEILNFVVCGLFRNFAQNTLKFTITVSEPMTIKNLFYAAAITLPLSALYSSCGSASAIDRQALVERNNPHITAIDTLASLSVGNGEFAVTVDVTGLQTFPELYSKGVPLGTQSQWGWHSFANPDSLRGRSHSP